MNVFIIGAGFTKTVLPLSPLNDDLFEELRRKKPDFAASALAEMYDENRIEVALTKFDCPIQAHSGAKATPRMATLDHADYETGTKPSCQDTAATIRLCENEKLPPGLASGLPSCAQSCKIAELARISSQQTKMVPNHISVICARPLRRIDNIAPKRWALFTVE